MAQSTAELTKKIEASQNLPAGEKKSASLPQLLAQATKQFEMALKGSGEDANRFARICLSVIRNNDNLIKIAHSNPQSVIAACMDIAALGLDPSIPNETFIIPYGSEAKQQTGYKGLAKLAKRAARLNGNPFKTLRCDTIRKNDTYRRSSGFGVDLEHIYPDFGVDRGEAIGYYALFETNEGGKGFVEMTIDEVREHQKKFCKSLSNSKSPWYNGQNFDAYGLKTVLRRLILRELEMSNKLASAVVNDDDDEGIETHGAVKIAPRDSDIEIEPAIQSNTEDTPNENLQKGDEGRT